MTISSSLSAGISGLAANAHRLATISDNIANSATYGYRRAITDFHSLMMGSGPGRYVAGGVATTSQRLIDESGALSSTSNPTDLAVRGRGFLPVSAAAAGGEGLDFRLTTTGSFRADEAGVLRTPDGQTLLGWPAGLDGTVGAFPRDTPGGLQPVRVPAGQLSGIPTTQVTLAVNLPATETQDGAAGLPEELTVEYYDNLGTTQQLGLTFIPTLPAAGGAPSNQWTMQITDGADGGALVGEYALNFDDGRDMGGTLTSVTGTTGGPYDPETGLLSIDVASGPVSMNIGAAGVPGGMTQLAGLFSPITIARDGAATGNMTAIEVDPGGFVHAYYDNGASRRLYQVPLVDVPNPNGLETHDGQSYSLTRESGDMLLWNAGDGPTGDVVGFAREESTVDVASELTQLIQTQRAYSSNAKVIQTVELSLAEETDLPVEISVWVLERSELIPLRVCSATIAPLLVRMLDIYVVPKLGGHRAPGFIKGPGAKAAGGWTHVLASRGPGSAPPRCVPHFGDGSVVAGRA
ncbi:Flagellar hook protein FlgE [Limimaricola hongkongensis DSM 17492]|uniref:Flagellar hook protein FlgE n=1 Tax=Limimaricola hongkongensis DSM 17492 TaxID=1122180 RepID=A0A017HF81_9RHOB|nr:Flagellar hook protein FlgE [Limimaricola hongkongensis DSM 17492]